MSVVAQLVLGSTSPFRRKLLTDAGLIHAAASPGVDEAAIVEEDAATLAMARARAKGLAVAARMPGCLVIGADQVLGLDGRTFDKAETEAEARQRLRELGGKTHHLHAAFVLAYGPRTVHEEIVSVAMPMRPLTDATIEAYLATGEWRGSVGCYQYEHCGVQLFEGVRGDQSAIIGLPLPELFAALRRLGIDPLVQREGPWRLHSPG